MKTQRIWVAACVTAALTMAVGAEAQEEDLGRPLHKVTDAKAGTEVRIYQPRPGETAWVAADSIVTVRKVASRARTVTTLQTDDDKASVTITPAGVTVERGDRRITATPGGGSQTTAVRELIQRSEALRHGIALLGRISLGPKSPIEHQLKTTRAVLLSVVGNRSGMVAIRALVEPRTDPRVIAVDYQSPTECWETYVKEAMAAFKEYEDCLAGVSWWEVFDWMACAIIYDMRAIGAFAWWLRCVGLGIGDVTVA